MSNIELFNKTVVQTGVRFTADIVLMIFNTSATFRVCLYDAQDKIIDFQDIIIQGQDYLNWNNNDDYIINYIANKLGFVIKK